MTEDISLYKRQAGEHAVDQFVQSNMIVGLGHGSTAIWALRHIAAKLASGELKNVMGIPCSSTVESDAKNLGLPLTTLLEHSTIDVTIDGADEFDSHLNLIKGGGGALLREKIVAQVSKLEIIVADYKKGPATLGTNWHVPVEVTPFGWRTQVDFLNSVAGTSHIREVKRGQPFLTDQGNYILDWNFGQIPQPAALAAKLDARAGIIEHGLFVGLASEVIIAGPNGIRHLKRE